MWIGPPQDDPDDRPWPVLLFDLWNDPQCIAPVNEQQPNPLDKYTWFLIDQSKAHQELATVEFTRASMPDAYRLIRVLYRFINPD